MARAEEALAPVFRVADTEAAIAWYRRLGFVVGYQYSTGPAFSRTMVVLQRGDLALVLSNREEDAAPNGLVCMRISNVDAIADEFSVEVKNSGLSSHIELCDPDGNRLRIGHLDIDPASLKGPRT